MTEKEFADNVNALYAARGKSVGPAIIAEWRRVLGKYDDGQLLAGFQAMSESPDAWPNPGKMKCWLDGRTTKYSVDAQPTTRTYQILPAPSVEETVRRCKCGERAVRFGTIPITLCGGCLWGLMLKPREVRITEGREAGIPVLDDGTVRIGECV